MRIYSRIDSKSGAKKWGIDYLNPATNERVRKIIGTNKKQAEDVLAKIKTEIIERGYFEKNEIKNKSFIEAEKEYIDYVRKNKKTFIGDIHTLKLFGDFNSPATNNKKVRELLLSEITTKMIEDYKTTRISKNVTHGKDKSIIKGRTIKPATVNKDLSCLKHFFYKNIEWGYTDLNPAKKVKLFILSNGRTRFFEQDEIEALLKACDEADPRAKHLKSIVIVALNTGMRKGEILGLKWKNIDFKYKIIYTGITKNGERQIKKMNSDVADVLSVISPFRNKGEKLYFDDYVFRNKDGKPFIDVKKSYNTALGKAKITGATFHTLRHTFGSHLMMKTGNIIAVKEALGQKCLKMTERYSHLSESYKESAVEGLYKKQDGTDLAQSQVERNVPVKNI